MPPVLTTLVVHLELRISLRIFKKKIGNGPNGILRGLGKGKLIHEKNLRSKISWRYPFKATYVGFLHNHSRTRNESFFIKAK
jgi:hypothetical protein